LLGAGGARKADGSDRDGGQCDAMDTMHDLLPVAPALVRSGRSRPRDPTQVRRAKGRRSMSLFALRVNGGAPAAIDQEIVGFPVRRR